MLTERDEIIKMTIKSKCNISSSSGIELGMKNMIRKGLFLIRIQDNIKT